MMVDEATTLYRVDARGKAYYFCGETCMETFQSGQRIAYFSMEIGVENEIHTYSGGLGILAGDTVRSSADLRLPLVAVTLLSRKGYLKQEVTPEGRQIEHPDEWEPAKFMRRVPNEVQIRDIDGEVKVGGWIYDYQSPVGGMVPILFLDTDMNGNRQEDREITSYLYGGDERYRLKQELILGIGGVRMLEATGFKVRKYHMNEGHSGFLALELLMKGMSTQQVKEHCVFTTHTPVEAAFDKFSYNLVQDTMGGFLPLDMMKKFGGDDQFNMTLFALSLSKYVNGVAESHRNFSTRLFPGYHINAITNGVHSYTWIHKSIRDLFDRYIPSWANEPMLLVRADIIPEDELLQAHLDAKMDLFELVKKETGVQLNPHLLTLGFARRFTAYKRPTLIFTDLQRLQHICDHGRFQILFAGKAHPRDELGKHLIQEVYGYVAKLEDKPRVVYLPNYDMDMAAKMVSGVDVWLNTPLPPLEASGTSGMKAAHNGILNFSVLDGWWIEGCVEGVTGWAIGPRPEESMPEERQRTQELEDLYNKLEYLILPLFYEKKDEWIGMMRSSITKLASYFNSHRMMRRYATDAYL